jgi:hypothetical protein
MKIEQDEKVENPTDEHMSLDLTVCENEISFFKYVSVFI